MLSQIVNVITTGHQRFICSC